MNDKQNKTSPAVSVADLEPYLGDASTGEKHPIPLDSQSRIYLHSRRHRLTDSDGISGKATIDGLVNAKVLHDDRPDYVQRVSYSQEKIPKTEHEETIITIEVL